MAIDLNGNPVLMVRCIYDYSILNLAGLPQIDKEYPVWMVQARKGKLYYSFKKVGQSDWSNHPIWFLAEHFVRLIRPDILLFFYKHRSYFYLTVPYKFCLDEYKLKRLTNG